MTEEEEEEKENNNNNNNLKEEKEDNNSTIDKMEIYQENESITTEIIYKEEESDEDEEEEEEHVDTNFAKKLKLTGRMRELAETENEKEKEEEEEYQYSNIDKTSLKQFLKQFDKAIIKGLDCSTEIHCNTYKKERLRDYLKECYTKKKIEIEQVIKLCKNVFYLNTGTNNYTVNIYLHKHNARRYIYQLCNKFFHEEIDSYLMNKYVPRSYIYLFVNK